jgi:hypothetical protein
MRATTALIGKKAASAMSPEEMFAYWSARVMRVPPPLKTSFGNFTVLNSVIRFTVTTFTSVDKMIWIPWSPSALAAVDISAGTAQIPFQHIYTNLVNSTPLQIRPLRMSFSVENTTAVVGLAGSVRILSVDNSVVTRMTLGATASTSVTNNTVNTVDDDIGPLVDNSLDTEEMTAGELVHQHEFVSVPSSFPAYNTYYDFVNLSGTSTNVAMRSDDWQKLAFEPNATYPYTAATATTTGRASYTGGLGGLPPMRGFLLRFPATPLAQTYRFEIHRQDGARYAANTLGALFQTGGIPQSSHAEDLQNRTIHDIARAPSKGILQDTIDAVQNGAAKFQDMLGKVGNAGAMLLAGGQLASQLSRVQPSMSSLATATKVMSLM